MTSYLGDAARPIIRKREHLVVFKEMSGNYATGISISLLSIAVGFIFRLIRSPKFPSIGLESLWLVPIVIFLILLVIALKSMNKELGDEQRVLESLLVGE